MKQILLTLAMISLLAATPMAISHTDSSDGNKAEGSSSRSSAQLSEAELNTLLFMREEEKAARDVYLDMYALWQHPVFSNIARSEQSHMDAMAKLIEKYDLVDPVVDDSIGVFTDASLLQMYLELVEDGANSLTDALYVGAYIEEIDIQDLENAIAQANRRDIIKGYENLLRGSRNHLRAFVGQIESLGIAYQSQVLPQWEVDLILSEPMERGSSSCQDD